jgi:hypothetical protein
MLLKSTIVNHKPDSDLLNFFRLLDGYVKGHERRSRVDDLPWSQCDFPDRARKFIAQRE